MPRFPGPAESRFRTAFAAAGARTIWKGLSELAIPGPDGGIVTASAGVAVQHTDNLGCPDTA